MKKAIKNLKIQNFKSIRHLELECNRVNVFIGKPNVGKSNILEALALYTLPDFPHQMKDFLRFNQTDNLFHYKLFDTPISVSSEIGELQLKYFSSNENFGLLISDIDIDLESKNLFDFDDYDELNTKIHSLSKTKHNRIPFFLGNIDNYGKIIISYKEKDTHKNLVRKYDFHKEKSVSNFVKMNNVLIPPYGINLTSILESNRELQEEISEFFKEYKLEFVLDRFDKKIEIQRRFENFVDKIPYSLIADTLQRIIFHFAAVESNKDSILLFEEPENHSFPPYIRALAEKIVESESNQFFITTHSPYLFNTLMSDTKEEDLAVFVTMFDNYETKIKKLSSNEISELMDYGVDVFFNLKWFENE